MFERLTCGFNDSEILEGVTYCCSKAFFEVEPKYAEPDDP